MLYVKSHHFGAELWNSNSVVKIDVNFGLLKNMYIFYVVEDYVSRVGLHDRPGQS